MRQQIGSGMGGSTRHSEFEAENSARVIRASEIGQYAYCARAWWLGSVAGMPATNANELWRGRTIHRWHGRAVWLSRALLVAAAALAALALVIALGSFVR
jgi:CRISPR/Cas system-associated exonuclease Cas4 (RecB family)